MRLFMKGARALLPAVCASGSPTPSDHDLDLETVIHHVAPNT
jgi:hypothetical protein